MRNFLVFESQKLWFNIPGRENTMRNKSLIHTKDVKTQEGTPLHLEYYLLNDSVLGGCAECYGVEILAQTGEAASRASPCAGPASSRSSTNWPTSPSRRIR